MPRLITGAIAATVLGASVAALESNYFGASLAAFMLAIFFIGVLSFGFCLERTAYRYASVTLAIIVLIPRTNPACIVALHRFIKVSVGIVVALLVVAIWPGRSAIAAKNAANNLFSARGGDSLEARIVPERIEHRIEPEQRGSERHGFGEHTGAWDREQFL